MKTHIKSSGLIWQALIRFTVTSDHRSLEMLEDSKINSGRLAKKLEQLSEFNFNIQHKPEESGIISVADALSRLPRHRKIQEDGQEEQVSLFEVLGLGLTHDSSPVTNNHTV